MTTKLQNLLAAVLVCAVTVRATTDPKIEEKQKDIRGMVYDTLQRL